VGGNTTITGNITAANANVTSNLVLSGGTANGVAFLNGAKVLTTGSALTFDGTLFSNTQTSASGGLIANLSNSTTGSFLQFSAPGVANVRIGNPNADALAFYTFGGGTYPEGFRLTSTSLYTASTINVGIGTSTPYSNAAFASLTLGGSSSAKTGLIALVTSAGADSAHIDVYNSQLRISTNGTSNPIAFYTGGSVSQNMTLDASGNLLVGKTSSSNATNGAQLSSTYQYFTNTSDYISIFNRKGTDGISIYFQKDETNVGTISVTTVATTFNSLSDYRLKNITGSLTGAKDFIMALQPKQGTWKADGSKFVGFLAHEFQEISASSVTGVKDAVDEDGKPIMQSMQASSAEVMANLVAFVQELKAEIDSLKSQLNGA
jgi:hypothetical protein